MLTPLLQDLVEVSKRCRYIKEVTMAFMRNSKTLTEILVVIGLILLSMLPVFSISCQPQTSPEEEMVTEEEPVIEEEPTPTSTKVKISGFTFVPATVTVSAGSTVAWTNQDSAPHTVTSETDLFDSGRLSINDSSSYAFTDRGTFSYYCTIHPYMKGEVIVE